MSQFEGYPIIVPDDRIGGVRPVHGQTLHIPFSGLFEAAASAQAQHYRRYEQNAVAAQVFAPSHGPTERQADQLAADQLRAENLSRANGQVVDFALDPSWGGVKL